MRRRVRGVVVLGCGLMGRRRARVAAAHPRSQVVGVVDVDPAAARSLADELGCEVLEAAQRAVQHPGVDIVVVCTPNADLAPLALEALAAGRHVLLEKPMGASLADAEALVTALQVAGSPRLKVGFNHRYHPALRFAHQRFAAGSIGRLTHLRACYGHGGRPGYEQEWRGDPRRAGGGELTDQGVHLLDLLGWFAGDAQQVVSLLRTAAWPVGPLEDNAHAMLVYPRGVVAQLHTSWTQWKNLFRLEIFGDQGALLVEGLGGSYGVERCTELRRAPQGGPPEMEERCFAEPDPSWELEWDDFLEGLEGRAMASGEPRDGLAVMRVLDALYRSAARGQMVEVHGARA